MLLKPPEICPVKLRRLSMIPGRCRQVRCMWHFLENMWTDVNMLRMRSCVARSL